MNKQLPFLASTVALSACNSGKINIIDQITDGEIVSFCQELVKCSSDHVYEDYYLFECVDSVRDERHRAVSLDCGDEFNELVACQIKEAPERSCRSDFDELSDYEDYLEDLYEDYYDNADACEKEEDDYDECIEDFMGTSSGGDEEEEDPYYGYYYE